MKQEVLGFQGVRIEDYQTGAIRDATFSLYGGEAVIMTGLFNSGLMTLAHILSGKKGAFEGEVRCGGGIYGELTPALCSKLGIKVIGRHHLLAENINIRDNLRMLRGKGEKFGVMEPLRFSPEEMELLRLSKLDIDRPPQTPFERVKWDIMVAYLAGSRIMVFMDMETCCNNEDFIELTEILFFLKTQNTGLIFVVFNDGFWRYSDVSDRCMVMRRGMFTTTLYKEANGLYREEDIRHVVVGRKFPRREFPLETATETEKESGVFARLTSSDRIFSLHTGTVTGLYDSDSRIPRTIDTFMDGLNREMQLMCGGQILEIHSARDLVRNRIAVILNESAERLIFKDLSPAENVAFFAGYNLHSSFYNKSIAKYLFTSVTQRYSILKHCAGLCDREDCRDLSYQEMFALILAKWLAINPVVVILFTELSNEDIKMTERFRDLEREMAEEGKAVLLVSSDYDRLEQDCGVIYDVL